MTIEPKLRTAVLSAHEASGVKILEVLQVGSPDGAGVLFLDLDDAAVAATKVILDAWKPRLAIVTTVEAEERLTVDLLAASWLRVVYVDPDDEEEDDEDDEERLDALRTLLRGTVQEMAGEDQPTDHRTVELVYGAVKARMAAKEPEAAPDLRMLGREALDAAEGLLLALRSSHAAQFRTQAAELAEEIRTSAGLTAGASKAAIRTAVTMHMKLKDPRCATREATEPIVSALEALLRSR